MKIIKTKVNFHDKRGDIRDILTHDKVDAITLLTCKKGSVRGNHYHKKTTQYDYILKGSFLCFTQKSEKGKKGRKLIRAGDLVSHPPGETHAFKALEDSEFISMTLGPRRGKYFEKDTFRLAKPLVV